MMLHIMSPYDSYPHFQPPTMKRRSTARVSSLNWSFHNKSATSLTISGKHAVQETSIRICINKSGVILQFSTKYLSWYILVQPTTMLSQDRFCTSLNYQGTF